MMFKMQLGKETKSWVHCPICTHTVEAKIVLAGKTARAKPGEKCPRCGSLLDAGWVLVRPVAA